MSTVGNIYRRLYGRTFSKPTNFSWVIEGELAGSGMPFTAKEVEFYVSQGIGAVLSLTEDSPPSEWFSTLHLKHGHIPIDDHTSPSQQQLLKAIDFIKASIKEKKPVVVHCHAGQGRTGTILAAYLISKGKNPAETIKMLREERPGSVEIGQEPSLLDLHEKLNGKSKP
jgi:atypical dual specificity phosphatase